MIKNESTNYEYYNLIDKYKLVYNVLYTTLYDKQNIIILWFLIFLNYNYEYKNDLN